MKFVIASEVVKVEENWPRNAPKPLCLHHRWPVDRFGACGTGFRNRLHRRSFVYVDLVRVKSVIDVRPFVWWGSLETRLQA
ncbi:hypothetical protein AVEN_97430-1 [Araneus ventricosus]|uniref:Uncharacterized protein n=1 Tax=Araneus ventricosus TaxID=182803 RepID=A0A4Y2EJ12_ARAVE|nr:hypothetical protein AVEN_97430-1 [Araneus ventricosus]